MQLRLVEVLGLTSKCEDPLSGDRAWKPSPGGDIGKLNKPQRTKTFGIQRAGDLLPKQTQQI